MLLVRLIVAALVFVRFLSVWDVLKIFRLICCWFCMVIPMGAAFGVWSWLKVVIMVSYISPLQKPKSASLTI